MVRQDEEGLRVPKWLLSAVAAALLAIGGNGINTWARANANEEAVSKHEHRLENLEKKFAEININIGKLQQSVADMKEAQQDLKDSQNKTGEKIDRVLELESRK